MRRMGLWLLALILLGIILPRIMRLDGGIIAGEPDAFAHAKIVGSLIQKGLPLYQGVGFYFDLPGYFWVSALFSSLFFRNPYEALRFVSLLSAILTSFIIGYYLKEKEDKTTGGLGAVCYFLIPLSIFYLRVGIIEPFLLVSLSGASFFFDLALEKNSWRYSMLAGIFLGFGLITKYSILPVGLAIFLFFLVRFFKDNQKAFSEKYLYLDGKYFLPILESLLIFLPVFLFFYFHDPLHVKWQTKQIFGLTGEVRQELRLSRLLDFPWWFSWPVVSLSLVGLARSVQQFKRYRFLLLTFFLLFLATLSRLPFYPRYLLVLLPFVAVWSARGLSLLVKTSWLKFALIILILVINLHSLVDAYQSSSEGLVEAATAAVKQRNFKPAWVFSNFWPNFFADQLGVDHYSWVTASATDMDSFAKGEKRDTITILESEGGVVFLERTYANLYLTQSQSRLTELSDFQSRYRPAFTVADNNSNFPFLPTQGNRIDVYLIKPPPK